MESEDYDIESDYVNENLEYEILSEDENNVLLVDGKKYMKKIL